MYMYLLWSDAQYLLWSDAQYLLWSEAQYLLWSEAQAEASTCSGVSPRLRRVPALE